MPEPPNPYQAPRAELGPERAPPSPRTAWKAYAYAIVALQLLGLYSGLAEIDGVQALDFAVTGVGVVGLFGFAYRRPILERWFWKPWSVLNPAWDIAMGLWVYPRQEREPVPGAMLAYFLFMLLIVPQYVALVRYGYFSPEVWRKRAEKDAGPSAN
jgi:hypothetical protein